jgi:hypothetical protein
MVIAAISCLVVTYLGIRGGAYDALIRSESGLAVWFLIAFGVIVGFLPRGRITLGTIAPALGIAALAVLTLVSLAWTDSVERTYAEFARVLIFAGMFWLILLSLNRYTWSAAAAGATVGAIAVCALAVASRLAPSTFPDYDIALAFDTDRLSYPLDYWNAVAAWGSMAAAMALGWSANARAAWVRGVSLAAVPLAATAVYLTYSRAGAADLAVGAAVVVALSRNRWTASLHLIAAVAATGLVIAVIRGHPAIADATGSDGGAVVALVLLLAGAGCAAIAVMTGALGLDRIRLEPATAKVVAPVAIVVALVATVGFGGGEISQRWDEFQNQSPVVVGDDPAARLTQGGGTRRDVWDSATDAFSSAPLAGIGPGTFEFWWAREGHTTEFLRDAHSLYLEEMAELGLLGTLLLIGSLGSALVLAIRARFRMRASSDVAAATAMVAGAGVYLVHAGIDWMWEETAVTVLGLGALAVVLASRSERTGRRHVPSRGKRIALVAFALVAGFSQIPLLVSTARTRESAEALAAGHTSDARQLASEAIDAEPWATTPYAARAAVEVEGGDYRAARTDISEAIDREPENWRHRMALVQIELADGRRSAAARAFAEMRVLSLTSGIPYQTITAMARDAVLRQETRNGCLAYRTGACGFATSPPGPRCLDGDTAAAAIREVRGPELSSSMAVRVIPAPNAEPVYYVAGEVGGRMTTWAVDVPAYRSGFGDVVPLNDAAAGVTTLGPPFDPEAFGLSPSDKGARAATNCLERG